MVGGTKSRKTSDGKTRNPQGEANYVHIGYRGYACDIVFNVPHTGVLHRSCYG